MNNGMQALIIFIVVFAVGLPVGLAYFTNLWGGEEYPEYEDD